MSHVKAAAANKHILIAEDSVTQAQRLQHILRQEGYDVTVAANGRVALEMALKRKPMLVISDVVMPEMDGYELCQSIKADVRLGDVPVILVTTLSDSQDVIRGLECRADHFILKPYDESYLLGRVQFVLMNPHMRQPEQTDRSLEIFFNGEKHRITSDRLQILSLLLSTYEAAIQRNKELSSTQDTLQQTNSELQLLTRELEDRVLKRTQELGETNEALRSSQQRFQTLAESLPQLIWTCTQDGRCDYLNSKWQEYTGHPIESLLGYGWLQHLHPEDRDRVRIEWARALLGGGSFDSEFRLHGIDSHYRWFKSRAIPLRDADRRIVKWFGANTDFEDFKRSEEKLQTQVIRRDLLNSITRAIGERQDLQSIFQVVTLRLEDHLPVDFSCICLYEAEALRPMNAGVKNSSLAAALKADAADQKGLSDNELSPCLEGNIVNEADITHARAPFLQSLQRAGLVAVIAVPLMVEGALFGILVVGRHGKDSFSGDEAEFLRQLGGHVAIAAHQAQLHAALQRAYDDLQRSQQAVMQQDRLRALGQMASGVAHDINNAISPISLYTESLLETERGLSPQARSYLTTIRRAIGDVAQTVARMREFYRPRESENELLEVQLNRLIPQVVDLTKARWRDESQRRGVMIDVVVELDADLPEILGAESEIRDALTNLILNAVDAMPTGGQILIRTMAQSAGPSFGSSVAIKGVLEVTDGGTGMDEETRQRCLEPFYTTKGERGTGLGLAMVYGMAQRHNADLEIDSELGRGTTIRLIFPAATATSVTPIYEATSEAAARPLRVLVVDDDELLLEALILILTAEGHNVTGAQGGQAGIDIFLAAQALEPFELVVTDLGMPYVDGRKVAETIRSASSSVWITLLTGWGKQLEETDERPLYIDFLLSKPPRLEELRDVLARCAVARHDDST